MAKTLHIVDLPFFLATQILTFRNRREPFARFHDQNGMMMSFRCHGIAINASSPHLPFDWTIHCSPNLSTVQPHAGSM